MSNKHIAAALRLLATGCALNPSDKAALDRHLDAICGNETPKNVAADAPVQVVLTAAPASTLAGRNARRGRNRSAVSGEIVTAAAAAASPDTTVTEAVQPARKRKSATKRAKK